MPRGERRLQVSAGEAGEVEVLLIRLPDGRIVARTADELAPVPEQLQGPVVDLRLPEREER